MEVKSTNLPTSLRANGPGNVGRSEINLESPPAEKTTVKRAPMTGAEYLESLRDGREVYICGERVKDVTTHPAFRNSARMIARVYDSLHDPEKQKILTTWTDTGNNGFTHRFYRIDRSVEEVRKTRDAIAESARIGFGWLGRSPEYKASLLATFGPNADFYKPFDDNARLWYREAQKEREKYR
ncbi:MAG: 4-hydroxyphenylacetate 3-hydroxylase N-terminal domain-containing protein [Candidatus Binatia bacterium]